MKRRFFLLLLSILLCFSLHASAAVFGDVTYVKIGNKVSITGPSDPNTTSVAIPSEIDGSPVTSIFTSAFTNCANLTYISIPGTITDVSNNSISDAVIKYCTINTDASKALSKAGYSFIDPLYPSIYLRYFYSGDDITKLSVVDADDGILEAVIPEGVTSIDGQAFSQCSSLTSITIPNSVTSIGYSAFKGCSSLTSIEIPDSVTSISDISFYLCDAVRYCAVNSNASKVLSSAGYSFVDPTCPGVDIRYTDSEEGIPGYAVIDANENIVDAPIPDGVKIIDISAFSHCSNLTNVTIPDSVVSIGSLAFYKCTSLTSVTIPDSVTSISSDAFSSISAIKYCKINTNGSKSLSNAGYSFVDPLFPDIYLRYYNSVDGISGYAVVSANKSITNVIIPDGITFINDNAFYNYSNVSSIIIPDSVISIGYRSFAGCSNLTSVDISNSVTSISNSSFSNCSSLSTITIPDSVTSIGVSAFSGCSNLNSVSISNSVTTISDSTFSNCSSLSSVTIPDSVTSIGASAFSGCSNLSSITISNSVTSISNSTFSNCSSLSSITIPDSVTSIGVSTFSGCSNLNSVAISNSVTTISDSTFSNCSRLSSITIPDSVTSIGVSAFSGCSNLSSVAISNSVNTIGDSSFSKCTSLSSITIPDSVTSIGVSAFSGCSNLSSISLPDSLTSIGDSAFSDCSSLSFISLPNCIFTIGSCAFNNCTALSSITFPESAFTIQSDSFKNCPATRYCTINSDGSKALSRAGYSFKDPQYPDYHLRYFNSGDYASRCAVISVEDGIVNATIPNGITCIGGRAFNNCADLISVTFPDSFVYIGDNAFENCSALSTITIPDSITYVGADAFKNCPAIRYCTIDSNGSKALSKAKYSFSVSQSPGIRLIYKYSGNDITDLCASSINTSIVTAVIPYGVTSIPAVAFLNCTSLTSVTIPESVTSIDVRSFENCTSLTSVTIPDSLEYIRNDAFNYCPADFYCTIDSKGSKALSSSGYSFIDPQYPDIFLRYSYSGSSITSLVAVDANESITTANIPDSVTAIGSAAFYKCSELISVTIPDSVTSIGNSAFSDCTSLNSLAIPNSITSITTSTFSGCSSLATIAIPDSVSSIGNSAFSGCTNLISISIPDSVSSIGNSAFSGCSSLTSIAIPDLIVSIGASTFAKCSSLTSITIPDSVTSIGDFAFSDCTSLTTISIPNSVTSIGKSAFTKCSALSSITLADSVTSIGDSAFSYCSSLSSITIPDSVTSIGNSAFYGCSNLLSITIPNSVTFIGSQAFRECTSLTFVSLPDSITTIESLTFSGCSKLSSITIPSTVTTIGSNAFNSCSSLTYIDFPDSVTSIGPGAFAHCYGFLSITIPKTVTSIGSEAFRSCTDLFSITLSDPETSITIGERAFWDCANIEKVYISSSIHDLPDVLFSYSNKLTIYCHEYSDADFWASNLGYNIVYVDSTDFSTVQTVELFPQQLTIPKGYNGKLLGTVFPDVSVPGLIWSSSAPGIASVDETGTVSALSKGTAVISLTVGDKTATASVECYVPVESFSFPEEEWILAKSSLSLMPKDYYPADADPVFSWASSDETIATVDQSGLVTAKKPGDVQITITSDTGIQKSCIVHLCYPVTDISFDADTLVIPAQTQTLLVTHVTMRDQHCDNHLVQFSSSDETVATIDENGMITPLKTGMVTFTATAESGVTASIECSVMPCSQHTVVIDPAVAPTCTENGLTQGSHCSVCGTVITRQESVPALGHDWNDATYSWAADNSTVTATHICKRDATHTETETAAVTAEVTKPAACEVAGETTYSAAFTNAAFAPQSKTLADIPATGHDWREAVYTWAIDNTTVTATHVCKHDDSHTETETATVTTEVTKPATCEEAGETTYTAAFTGSTFDTQIRVLADIPPLGHNPILVPGKLPSSGESGHTSGNICSVCGKVLADHLPVESVQTLALPVALRTVADSAFARTAADHVLLPAGATAIGPRAFADAPNLRFVTVPDSVNSIAPDAFEGCSLLTFFCSDSSAAAAYAEAHGFAHTAP